MSRPLRQIDPSESARHLFAWTLRNLRVQAGFSLQGFARRLGKSVSYLSEVEGAQVRCTREFAAACDALLNADNRLLDLWAAADRDWEQRTGRRHGSTARRTAIGQPSELTHALAPSRMASIPMLIAPFGEPLECATVDADLTAMQAFRAADRQVGGGHLYATVVAYLHEWVAPRLFGGNTTEDGMLVLCAAAALTEMAGWMAHDAGLDDRAERHFDRALSLAPPVEITSCARTSSGA
jgi:transcriptional regulator with XRE-family HTH domain